ncbi:MAG: hypothetical protein HLUCCA05_04645 [Roseibaca calidilacus]|jgi:hypothetical protein|uniref:Uncharacterized protein n=1 Tax=Roseibaca calidilacus TaxID=1666912 RepID=A0A0P7YPE0_9RHOB|nr:MAG: hypothetical protein HLUCCA05_04645 [Roseibaca calidilacus]
MNVLFKLPLQYTAEIHIHLRIALMNRFDAIGTAEIARVEEDQQGKGQSRLRRDLRNNAVWSCCTL